MTTALLQPDFAPAAPAVPQARPVTAAARTELAIVPGLILLQLLVLGDPLPLTRLFWLDEIHTALLVEDPDLAHADAALAGGVDFNPPTYFLLARLVTLAGIGPEISLRSFSLGCVIISCISIYFLVRDRCSPVVAAAAALLIWSVGVVQEQAFEARFYAPWLAAAGLVSLCLQRCCQLPSLLWRMGLALSAIVLCTIHYFGVISLALIVGTLLLEQWRSQRFNWRLLAWLAPGIAALGLCIPLFYAGQRSALSVPTWVPPATWRSAWQFSRDLVPLWALLIAGGVWILTRVCRGAENASEVHGPALPPAAGLALMPAAVLAFSLLMQPALVSRYAAVGALGFAVLVAALLRRSPTWVSATFGVWFFLAGLFSLHGRVGEFRRLEIRQADLMARLRQLDPQTPLLFESRHTMYPVVRYAPDLAPRARFLVLSNAHLKDFHSATPFRIVERDVALRIERAYPAYRTIPFDDVRRLPRAVLVAFRQRNEFGGQWAGFQVTTRHPPIYEIAPRTGRSAEPVPAETRHNRVDSRRRSASTPIRRPS